MAKRLLLGLMLLMCACAYADTIGTQGLYKFYNDLASQGDPEAMYILANMYNEGRGTKQDLNKALQWYKKAAEHGITQAANKINEVAMKIRETNPAGDPRAEPAPTARAPAPSDGLERTIIFEQQDAPPSDQNAAGARRTMRSEGNGVDDNTDSPSAPPAKSLLEAKTPAAVRGSEPQVPVIPVQVTPVPVTPANVTSVPVIPGPAVGAGSNSDTTDVSAQTDTAISAEGAAATASGNADQELRELERQLKQAEEEATFAKEKEVVDQQVQLLKEQVESLKLQAERAYREAHTARQREAQYAKEKAEIEQQHEILLEKVEEMQDGLKYADTVEADKPKEVEFKANPCASPAARFMSTCK
jgi:hypothetical protein